jgi:hypothetical protein
MFDPRLSGAGIRIFTGLTELDRLTILPRQFRQAEIWQLKVSPFRLLYAEAKGPNRRASHQRKQTHR